MTKKPRIGLLIIAVVIGVVFFIQYIAYNTQKNSRADGAPTVLLSLEHFKSGDDKNFVLIKAKLSSGGVSIINYNFHVLFNTSSTVTGITYTMGAASAGLGDSDSNLATVNTRTGSSRYVNIFGEIGSANPAPLGTSFQEVARIAFDIRPSVSILCDANNTFTAYDSTTFVNTSLIITGCPYSLEGASPSSSSSSSTPGNSSSSSSSSVNSSSSSSRPSTSSASSNSSSGPTCKPASFKSASILPDVITAGGDVMVKCNYGEDLSCIKVTGGGLTNCTYRYYDKGDAVFLCKAPKDLGTYTSAVCKLSGPCCEQTNSVGTFYVVSTTPHFEQRMRLPAGSYVFSAKVQALIVKGKGVVVNLICRSPVCFTGKIENSVISSISYPASSSFVNKSASVTIPPAGSDKDYAVQIAVQDGSEAYIDNVNLMLGSTNYVVNSEFSSSTDGSVNLLQPIAWGVANNRLGFYYGMAYKTVPDYVYETHSAPGDPGGSGTSSGSGEVLSGPAVNMTLNLKIKLQGITKKPINANPIKVKVKLGGRALSAQTAYQTGTFTPGDNGVWTGSVNFNVPAGGGYVLYIKGPKHLQKKICVNNPSESPAGTYHCSENKVSLSAGNNTLDLSSILQLSGDLPATDGNQNGLIDSYDVASIRQNFQTTDQSKIAVGDLDFDNGITTSDWSLLVQSLGIKYDEE